MQYKVTQRLQQQKDNQLIRMDSTEIRAISQGQHNKGQEIKGSVVMGQLESVPTENPIVAEESEVNELIWQYQTRVGDQIVFHHLKDDGRTLSFMRASVNVKDAGKQEPTSATVEAEIPSHPPRETPVMESVEASLSGMGTTDASDPQPSVRSVISAGVTVNLLALSIGGYLLHFSPSVSSTDIATESTSQQQTKQSENKTLARDAASIAEIEAQAQKYLHTAYQQATGKDFTAAIGSLQQIPQNSKAYSTAQSKIAEYTEKQRLALEVRAHQLLQTAYNRAQSGDFAGALRSINQIPKGTAAYAKVPAKIAEYIEKQRVQLNAQNPAPEGLSASGQFTVSSRAISSTPLSPSLNPGDHLQEISPETILFNLPEKQPRG